MDVYIGVYVLFTAAMGSGVSLSNAPSVGKARESASTIFTITDEKSLIDVRNTEGVKEVKRGEIEFVNVDFKYPSRNQKVLD
jgi:ATP-binding cassette subfamily B (MDR/TAP) protein 1